MHSRRGLGCQSEEDIDSRVLLLLFHPSMHGPSEPQFDLQLVEILEYFHSLLHMFTDDSI